MNTYLLRIISAALLLVLSGAWYSADAPPPGLKELAPIKVEPFRGPINSLMFSPDSKTLFSRDQFGTVQLWDVEKRKNIATFGTGIRRMELSPDGKTLFSFTNDNVCLWDVASRKRTALLEHNLKKESILARTELSADGKTLAVLYGDAKSFTFQGRTVVLWDVPSRKRVATVEEDHEIGWIMLSPDGKTLATLLGLRAKANDSLRIWDVAKGKRVRSFKGGSPMSGSRLLVQSGSGRPVSPRDLGNPPKDISYKLIDPFTGDTVLTCKWDRKEGPHAQLFASNRAGTMLATLGKDGPLRLWEKASGKCLASIKPPTTEVNSLFFSLDGKLLFIGSHGTPGLAIYAMPSGKLLAEMNWIVNMFLALSPDGRLLAEPDSRSIKLWSIPDEWRKEYK